MDIVIITNNPDVAAAYPEISRYYKGGVLVVFIALRDMIHQGARLISHPLSGSVKPNESPYKSVAIAGGSSLDFKSLRMIEDAFAVLKKLPSKDHSYNKETLADFRLIDLELIKGAIPCTMC